MPDNMAMSDRDEALFAQQQVVRLQALLEASRLIHSTIALDDVLNTVLRIVVRELELDGAFFKHFLNSYGDVPQSFSVPEADAVGHPLVERTGDTTLWIRFPLHDKTGATFTDSMNWTLLRAWRSRHLSRSRMPAFTSGRCNGNAWRATWHPRDRCSGACCPRRCRTSADTVWR